MAGKGKKNNDFSLGHSTGKIEKSIEVLEKNIENLNTRVEKLEHRNTILIICIIAIVFAFCSTKIREIISLLLTFLP